MSYILDALRRAERERRLGQTPTVESLARRPHEPPRSERSPLLPLLIVATLAISVIAALLLARSRTVAADAVARSAAPEPMASTPVAAAPPPPRSAPEPSPPAIEDSESIASLDDLSPSDGEHAEAATETPPPEPSAEVRARVEALPLQAEDSSAVPAAPAPAPAMPPGTTAVAPAVPTLREMPDAYRAGFPAITLDVHVYDADPARRWIMVDARRFRENDSLPNGARIAQITADGVVIHHQDREVLIPVR